MSSVPAAKLDRLVSRWQAVQGELNSGVEQQRFVELSKEFAELNPVVETINELRRVDGEVESTRALAHGRDTELAELAAAELPELEAKLAVLENDLKIHLLPKDAADEKSAIIEVRAGTGGDEAALFAADLFRMYARYAELHGWKTEIISESENALGGYKEVIASITGKGVFAKLKFESGVHRVQRVPATEASGRIHTSAATVAVLPEAEEVDLQAHRRQFGLVLRANDDPLGHRLGLEEVAQLLDDHV